MVGFFILLMPLSWFYTISSYFYFVRTFNYKNGWLSSYSDIPFSFADKSLEWIFKDARKSKYKNIHISSDQSDPKNFDLPWSANYILKYVYKSSWNYNLEAEAYYLLLQKPISDENLLRGGMVSFGPYVMFKLGD